MNKEIILGGISAALFIFGVGLLIAQGYISKPKEGKERNNPIVTMFVMVIFLLWYWGMGTFNVLDYKDFLMLLYFFAYWGVAIGYKGNWSLNTFGKIIFGSASQALIWYAGGYDSLLKYFNI